MSRAGATFQEMLESWFPTWLMGHRGLSPQTVASYRDAFKLLVGWLRDERGICPEDVTFGDVGRDAVVAYLDWLRDTRGCSAKTVNCRLCAMKSFASYVACECPERSAWAKSLSSIKQRRESRPVLDFLTPDEVRMVADACDPDAFEGRRDAMMVMLMFNTGFRVTEVIELRASSFEFGDGSCRVTTVGKGRKERSVPLWPETSDAVSRYMDEAGIAADGYLFPGRNVGHLTRSGARSRLDSAFARASRANPALARKRCTPHTLRHSTAMAMLAAGIDLSTIAIWLGHESISTTHKYMVADMEMKERALERAAGKNPFGDAPKSKRYVPEPGLLAFLESL
ncbi:MAG: tyrosine-type recombinase/integrase [Atopobiaceae bacterium]|nr:tyrosine-type recombinase/integrase [Atopobiaceae bacterium]